MSTPFDDGYVPPTHSKRRILGIAGVVLVIAVAGLIGGPYLYALSRGTANSTCGSSETNGGLTANSSDCINMGVAITYQHDTFPRFSMLEQGYTPSCWAFCNGITYRLA